MKKQYLVDTHCHIHSADYELEPETVVSEAESAGVTAMICVGTDIDDSALAVRFAATRANCYASAGLHPHDSRLGKSEFEKLEKLANAPKVVAVGECGLDYYYSHSPRDDQIKALEYQIGLALKYDLPMIFHVREAFDDFWPIFDAHQTAGRPRGVIHSFSATLSELDSALSRDLYVGLNGIMTFTRDEQQLAAARAIPLQKLLLETDAPFLTPHPFRGKVNEPKHVRTVAEFLARLRGEPLEVLAEHTTSNARELFGGI
jgi:TatD DNase family protein